ncbi:DNA-binding transcriptional ArsR family regulator [Diaminobutyricimonas aerilata]|uniref:DNA-binding transcriptional ArsR family regulator n=1 Tax=Diaminobutyricimonas aerilata TaxID=1162967 RepID=A0A2M9CNY2_9MICO|nr:helix-turn-helix domain-containing protein [Diaminobutyricimonas aerilata]PJJ73607.1 DNA-binding transcriptional ArsR family regulator [Diaminobutyricimonas aerilata]
MPQLTHPEVDRIRLDHVLAALGNPVRLGVIARLAAGEHLNCTTALPDVPKSSASHHWRVLRESGLLHQQREGRFITMTLRRRELDERFPGLLDAVLTAAAETA